MKKELIFMGAPASGKGTQTKKLSAETGLVHVDTGSLLREIIASANEMGKLAKSFIEKGQLVPADLVGRIIKERLMQKDCENGFILDGYPRSLEQAETLDKILNEIDSNKETDFRVIYFDIDQKDLIERIVNRRSCPKCGAIFNKKTMPIKKEGICDYCESELVQRKDDTEEIAKSRFDTYFAQTMPLIDLYKKRGKLISLDANGSIDEIYIKLKEVLN